MRIVLVLSIAALAGCGQIPAEDGDNSSEGEVEETADAGYEDDLIGGWSCTQKSEEGAAEIEIDYASGGRSSAQIELTFEEEGDTVEVLATGSGTWEVEGDKLTEEITKFTIIGATVDDKPVDDDDAEAYADRLEEAMVGQVSTSTIKSLDQDSLFVDSSDGPVSCDRKG